MTGRDHRNAQPEKLEPIEIRVTDGDWANYYAPALALVSEPGSDFLSAQAQEIDLKVEIHPRVRGQLLAGDWAVARSLLAELRQALAADGFQPDGLRVVAGNSWRRQLKGAEG
jgi:hypothetical protein